MDRLLQTPALREWLFCGSAGQGHHLRVAATDLQVAVDACGSITKLCRSLGGCLKCGREMRVASREIRVAIAKCRGIGEFSGVCLWRIHGVPL